MLIKCVEWNVTPWNLSHNFLLCFQKSILDFQPTVIWSGNGYHVYLVLDSEGIILENIKDFSELTDEISLKFLRFTEWFLSNGKSNRAHNTTVSFYNCMLRIPGSYNSKNNAAIRIIKCQENTPATPAIPASIKPLLRDFRRYLIDQKLKEILSKSRHKKQKLANPSNNSINWIEQLLQIPITDHRKYCIWRILTPYLFNIRKLHEQECYDTIKEWLDSCSKLKRLDFDVRHRIRDGLEGAKEGYLPISFEKLKEENPSLLDYLTNIS
jgi:hypothetical protein